MLAMTCPLHTHGRHAAAAMLRFVALHVEDGRVPLQAALPPRGTTLKVPRTAVSGYLVYADTLEGWDSPGCLRVQLTATLVRVQIPVSHL
jgi:hypothetical protein